MCEAGDVFGELALLYNTQRAANVRTCTSSILWQLDRATFNAIVNEEGAAVLMKGVVPRVAFLAPLAAMTLSLYEAFGKELVSRRTGVPVALPQ